MGHKGLRYAVQDGFVNLKRHPIVLLASITTMFLMLLILGVYMVFAANVLHLLERAGQQPAVEIQFMVGAAEADVQNLARQFADNPKVIEYQVLSPQENIRDFQDKLGKTELFEDFDFEAWIPWTIRVRLDDPALAPVLAEECLYYPGVEDVQMAQDWMAFLEQTMERVSWSSLLVFLALSAIAVFIISNMIRIAALSRASELSIMKYVGATDRYIAIPFIIEGLAVGMIAAFLASVAILFMYRLIWGRFMTGVAEDFPYRLLGMGQVLPLVFLCSFLVGSLLGGVTSAVSIRKYIRV